MHRMPPQQQQQLHQHQNLMPGALQMMAAANQTNIQLGLEHERAVLAADAAVAHSIGPNTTVFIPGSDITGPIDFHSSLNVHAHGHNHGHAFGAAVEDGARNTEAASSAVGGTQPTGPGLVNVDGNARSAAPPQVEKSFSEFNSYLNKQRLQRSKEWTKYWPTKLESNKAYLSQEQEALADNNSGTGSFPILLLTEPRPGGLEEVRMPSIPMPEPPVLLKHMAEKRRRSQQASAAAAMLHQQQQTAHAAPPAAQNPQHVAMMGQQHQMGVPPGQVPQYMAGGPQQPHGVPHNMIGQPGMMAGGQPMGMPANLTPFQQQQLHQRELLRQQQLQAAAAAASLNPQYQKQQQQQQQQQHQQQQQQRPHQGLAPQQQPQPNWRGQPGPWNKY